MKEKPILLAAAGLSVIGGTQACQPADKASADARKLNIVYIIYGEPGTGKVTTLLQQELLRLQLLYDDSIRFRNGF